MVRENVAVGDPLLVVSATDRDSGLNAEIHFASDDPRFGVDTEGRVFAAVRLDADQRRDGFHIYRFNISATDGGRDETRRHTTRATIVVRTENVNDEAPLFVPTAEYTAEISEDAHSGTPLIQVQAVDADRDRVVYAFASDASDHDETHVGRTQHTTAFSIDAQTGLIRLQVRGEAVLQAVAESLTLPILATVRQEWKFSGFSLVSLQDDGSCCADESRDVRHTTSALVRVNIRRVRNRRPIFSECSSYSATARLSEGVYTADASPLIVRVYAVDPDSGLNGEIVYSLYSSRPELVPFIIDSTSGELRPRPGHVFDRETKSFEEVII